MTPRQSSPRLRAMRARRRSAGYWPMQPALRPAAGQRQHCRGLAGAESVAAASRGSGRRPGRSGSTARRPAPDLGDQPPPRAERSARALRRPRSASMRATLWPADCVRRRGLRAGWQYRRRSASGLRWGVLRAAALVVSAARASREQFGRRAHPAHPGTPGGDGLAICAERLIAGGSAASTKPDPAGVPDRLGERGGKGEDAGRAG